MGKARRLLLVPAVLAAALVLAAAADAEGRHKDRPKMPPPLTTQTQQAQSSRASYEPDGTPVATGAPRRLSILSASEHRVSTAPRAPLNRSKRKPAHLPR
jgi:hypothetical protein